MKGSTNASVPKGISREELTNTINETKAELQSQIGDIGTLLDTINGEVV